MFIYYGYIIIDYYSFGGIIMKKLLHKIKGMFSKKKEEKCCCEEPKKKATKAKPKKKKVVKKGKK
jgi:hypothetical protein